MLSCLLSELKAWKAVFPREPSFRLVLPTCVFSAARIGTPAPYLKQGANARKAQGTFLQQTSPEG